MSSHAQSDDTGWLLFGRFAFSMGLRELRRGGQPVALGRRAMDLLATLLSQAGQPVSKAKLIEAAWGRRLVEPSNLTVQIAILRRHLEEGLDPAAEGQIYIRTVPGFGYVFTPAVERTAEALLQHGVPPGALPTTPVRPWRTEPMTQFVGRESEQRELTQLLRTSRLVTVAGIGGVGKTRLTLRLRDELAAVYPDGVTFVDLAPLVEPDQVNDAVAAALGVGSGTLDAMAALTTALHGRRHLLILDNAEHLTAPTCRLAGHVLDLCPLVSVLVTSRDTLGIPGEMVFRLSPLELPPDLPTLTAEAALRFDAVQLLVARAQALLPGFAIDDGNACDIADICRRLDGIALAIEMAVPRLDVLTVRQLRDRLVDRFGALARVRHDVLARQRTLRAMFDWSWELLTVHERRLLQLLSISVGGTTLDELEALAAIDGRVGATDVLDQLTRLAQCSLVVVGRGGEAGPRYRVLETTRQYALEQLTAVELATLSRHHALTVAALFERAEAEWPVTHGATWLARYGAEADNLRWALQWTFGRADESGLALRLVAAGFSLWWELPELPLREARGWYAKALDAVNPATPPAIEAWLLLGQSWTDTLDDDAEHYPAAARAVSLFRDAGDCVGLGAALWRAASTVLFRDHTPPATQLVAEARDAMAGHPAAKWQALCQVRQADLLLRGSDLTAALATYDDALATMRRLGHAYGLMVGGGNRGYALYGLGRAEEAIAALRDLRATLPPGLVHPVLSLLAVTLAATGQDQEALEIGLESLAGTVSIGLIATLARTIEAVSLAVARAGDLRTAARLLGFALGQHPRERTRLAPRKTVFDRLRMCLDAELAPAVHRALIAEGARWTPEEAVAAAMGACQKALGALSS